MPIFRLLRGFVLLLVILIQASQSIAGTSDRVSFQISPKVVSQILDSGDGETRLLIASNSAFKINATGLIGEVNITIETSGQVGGSRYGGASQLPGQKATDVFLTSAFETPIYRSTRKTALDSGKPIDQAVLVRISYEGSPHPVFTVEPAL